MMSGVPYPVVDVATWRVAGIETDGQTEHMWLERPDDQRLWLFKQVVVKEGRRQGEDWVEKIASVIAAAINVPRAQVELAHRHGADGCIVRDIKPHQWQMFSGADLLTGLLGPSFDPRAGDAAGHSLVTIGRVLRECGPPPGAAPAITSALDCFAGYLVLDALIANRDRHPRNWAVLQAPAGGQARDELCPSFDHASGLGFGMTDRERSRWLKEGGIEAWVRRGTAKTFEHGPKPWPSLIDLAVQALGQSSQSAREYWREQVTGLTADVVRSAVNNAPTLSEVTRRFTAEVVTVNRRRLMEATW